MPSSRKRAAASSLISPFGAPILVGVVSTTASTIGSATSASGVATASGAKGLSTVSSTGDSIDLPCASNALASLRTSSCSFLKAASSLVNAERCLLVRPAEPSSCSISIRRGPMFLYRACLAMMETKSFSIRSASS